MRVFLDREKITGLIFDTLGMRGEALIPTKFNQTLIS
jgi:hypothetical protein